MFNEYLQFQVKVESQGYESLFTFMNVAHGSQFKNNKILSSKMDKLELLNTMQNRMLTCLRALGYYALFRPSVSVGVSVDTSVDILEWAWNSFSSVNASITFGAWHQWSRYKSMIDTQH